MAFKYRVRRFPLNAVNRRPLDNDETSRQNNKREQIKSFFLFFFKNKNPVNERTLLVVYVCHWNACDIELRARAASNLKGCRMHVLQHFRSNLALVQVKTKAIGSSLKGELLDITRERETERQRGVRPSFLFRRPKGGKHTVRVITINSICYTLCVCVCVCDCVCLQQQQTLPYNRHTPTHPFNSLNKLICWRGAGKKTPVQAKNKKKRRHVTARERQPPLKRVTWRRLMVCRERRIVTWHTRHDLMDLLYLFWLLHCCCSSLIWKWTEKTIFQSNQNKSIHSLNLLYSRSRVVVL